MQKRLEKRKRREIEKVFVKKEEIVKIVVSLSIGNNDLRPQVEKVFKILDGLRPDGRELEAFVVLAGHQILDLSGCKNAQGVADTNKRVFTAFANSGSFSRAYLKGMEIALSLGANYVVSMDTDGAHDPSELETFVNAFAAGKPIVFGSRFAEGGVNTYPLQRRFVSKAGTVLANWALTPFKQVLTDYTSGYEGIRADILAHVFREFPPDKWVCVTDGPYHLQNTEFRAYILKLGYSIDEVAIRYGVQKKGRGLKVSYILSAVKSFFKLALRMGHTNQVGETAK